MKNEVYGTMTLNFSKQTESANKELSFLQTAYSLDNSLVKNIKVTVEDTKGNITDIHIHDWNIELENFFNENE